MRPLIFCGAALTAFLLAFPSHAWERILPGMLRLSAPVYAQNAPPLQEDGCIALAEQMDVKEKAKQKLTPREKEVYEQCVDWFNCPKATEADAPEATLTNESLIRFVMKTCTGYDPPKGGK